MAVQKKAKKRARRPQKVAAGVTKKPNLHNDAFWTSAGGISAPNLTDGAPKMLASIDVGSNATRLLVAEVAAVPDFSTGQPRPLIRTVHQERMPVRMGRSVFRTGKLPAESIDALVRTMASFQETMSALKVETYRAVITASARGAENATELLRKVAATGITLESIDGSEEARLGKLAVESRLQIHDRRVLIADLGGGSLELTEVNHDEVRFSTSLEIGTVRLLETFLQPGKAIGLREERVLTEYIDRVLAPISPNFLRRNYDLVAGTGGNFDAVAELAPGPTIPGTPFGGGAVTSIDVQRARKLLAEMKQLTPAARQARFGLKADRADVIVPALFVILHVADLARTDTIVTPGVGLKEGLLLELARRSLGVGERSDANAAVRSGIMLGRRYQFDETHGTQVDRLATNLFDQLQELHKLGSRERILLRVAALVHDIGDFVEQSEHHKHTQYIVENSELLGVSPEEKNIVACIARYHRRAEPSAKHSTFKALTAIQQRTVRKLSSILRIADAFDRGHRSKVTHLRARVDGDAIVVEIGGREDLSLEIWTAERKSDLFQKVFRKRVRYEASS